MYLHIFTGLLQQTHLCEYIITWLLQCWDNGMRITELEGREAKLLGSLAETNQPDQNMLPLYNTETLPFLQQGKIQVLSLCCKDYPTLQKMCKEPCQL